MTYEGHRLPQLWTMVEADDGSAAAYHLNTWERQITLLSEQSKRLKDLRADLVERWPPDQSDASFAFVSRVTEMINAMDQTVDDSVRVRTGLKQVADALEGARKQLAPLLAQYHDKAAAWRSMTHGALPELPLNLASGASLIPGADEFVVQAHQRKLDEQARDIMRAADKIVTEAQVPLGKQMVDYARIDGNFPPGMPGDEGVGPRRASGDSPSPARRFVPPPRFDPPPAAIDVGPTLAGHDRPVVQVPPRGIPGVGTPNVGDGRRPNRGINGDPDQNANLPDSVMKRLPPGQSVLRPGGVIDGRHPAFEPRPSEYSPAQGPVGGSGGMAPIGLGRTGSMPSERATRPSQPGRVIEGGGAPLAPGMGGGWRDRQYEEYVKRRRTPIVGDPENPWAVAEGIAPVIEPPPEHRHDVGPGVIGIDR